MEFRITQADIDAHYAREKHYLDKPLKVITVKRWDYMLGVLPPLDWRTVGGVQRFFMIEYMTGDVTTMFMKYRGRFFECYAKPRDKATWPTSEQLDKKIAKLEATKRRREESILQRKHNRGWEGHDGAY